MFNHLVDDFTDLTDVEIDQKIVELGRKYWMTRNPEVQAQIHTVLEMFKEESRVRQAQALKRSQENGDSDLDNLINVS
jgi:hypothetical protein